MTNWNRLIRITDAVLRVLEASKKPLSVPEIVDAVEAAEPSLNVDEFDVRDAVMRLASRKAAKYTPEMTIHMAK